MHDPTIDKSIALLHQLIGTLSLSKQENGTAQLIEAYLVGCGIETQRSLHNVWAVNQHFDAALPTYLLNSHHDTVQPNKGYTRDPLLAEVIDGKLYGLGSNDAGGCLVALIACFVQFYNEKMPFNLVLACTAEEEISGKNGIASILPLLPPLAGAIVGEPTENKAAVAEKGLMVVDCTTKGVAGHAARNEGTNAILLAMEDIQWLQGYHFSRTSPFLGPVKASTTIIQAGSQHNVVPDQCSFTVDVRLNEKYSHQDILDIFNEKMHAQCTPRSMRLMPSFLPKEHRIYQALDHLKVEKFGSSTMSDQALIAAPSLKIGPGASKRSHTADEWVGIQEIVEGYGLYTKIINHLIELH